MHRLKIANTLKFSNRKEGGVLGTCNQFPWDLFKQNRSRSTDHVNNRECENQNRYMIPFCYILLIKHNHEANEFWHRETRFQLHVSMIHPWAEYFHDNHKHSCNEMPWITISYNAIHTTITHKTINFCYKARRHRLTIWAPDSTRQIIY